MLEVNDLHKTFNIGTINEKVALDGVNLKLNSGDFVTIIGGNGAGKSTTLNAIAGVWPIDQGKIIVDGVDITRLSEHKRAVYLGRVFQDPMTGTASTMSIEENMAIAARRGERRGFRWSISRKEREFYKEQLRELDLGLEERLTTKVGLLSGGQRQAITLLMASLKKPKLLLLDEHTAALDPKTAAKVLEISDKIIQEQIRRQDRDHPMICPYFINSRVFVHGEDGGRRMIPSPEMRTKTERAQKGVVMPADLHEFQIVRSTSQRHAGDGAPVPAAVQRQHRGHPRRIP